MNKYTIKYILSIIGVVLLAIIICAIWITLEEAGTEKPWVLTVVFATCLASFVHIVAGMFYDENKDEKNHLKVSNGAIGCIFLISIISQIICTFIVCFEAWKRFGNIHFIEYFIAAIFMLASVYFFKKASYKLINKEKKK